MTTKTNPSIAQAASAKLKNVVDKPTLEQLYAVQCMTLSAIGQRYGVTRGVIKRLVTEFGLTRPSRKQDELTPEILVDLYDQGLRYAEIARMYDCSPWIVNQMALAIGLKGRRLQNRAGIEPDSDQLREMYWEQEMTYEAIAQHFGVDLTTIPYWFKKFGIPSRVASGFGLPSVSKSGHQVRSYLECQVADWLYDHEIPVIYEPALPDSAYHADFQVDDVFIEIWGMVGIDWYERSMQKKQAYYKVANLKLLSIYPADFPDLDILSRLPVK
ncbi:MAG: hypothetical protein K8L99_13455 [Anaerolineae bacterium]|nr:hypothetical protein [Anaerolineae bacterium]